MKIDFSIGLEPSSDFKRIAKELINNYVINAGVETYQIIDIEFYYFGDKHKDTTVHKAEQQKIAGNWYIHPSGIDITFGTPESYGGILIRSIKKVSSNEYILGPLKTLGELFTNVSSIYDSHFTFGLIPSENTEEPNIISGNRIGLNPKIHQEWYSKPYRFIGDLSKNHKFKNKTNLLLSALQIGVIDQDEATEIMGYSIG